MGLATVLGTTEQHGGTVQLETSVGGGTKFTIVLPVTQEAGPEERTVPASDAVDEAPARRLLVIDDEQSVAEVTRSMLVAYGHQVEVATTPDEALKVWTTSDTPFDLVVCDITMPGMKGPALIEQLAETGPAPRVLFITGYSDEANERTGEHPILAKPFSVSDLMKAIEEAFV